MQWCFGFSCCCRGPSSEEEEEEQVQDSRRYQMPPEATLCSKSPTIAPVRGFRTCMLCSSAVLSALMLLASRFLLLCPLARLCHCRTIACRRVEAAVRLCLSVSRPGAYVSASLSCTSPRLLAECMGATVSSPVSSALCTTLSRPTIHSDPLYTITTTNDRLRL
ncbi:hypothetical protein BCV70DRAFT_33750 [Testicularia cyperi]|uniref:Uncharacterized protein n=1 Tax=Testicularia cyperi TaxID=1882483 RepID=A0A317XL68_9BASI|nr:hypothetical protein BCV70DRAFT_33750 [Testicularia cyperi]